MASQPQKSSRWGTFLSSVESRLDNILADEQGKPQQRQSIKGSEPSIPDSASSTPPPREASPVRSASSNRAQDRLNEKLARARANRAIARKDDDNPTSSGTPSRTASPANILPSPRQSLDSSSQIPAHSAQADDSIEAEQSPHAARVEAGGESAEQNQNRGSAEGGIQFQREAEGGDLDSVQDAVEMSSEAGVDNSEDVALHQTPPDTPKPQLNGTLAPMISDQPNDTKKTVVELQADLEAAEVNRQEETQELLEKIDTLQAKLQYLTKEALESARVAATDAKYGSPEQKLADRDEKIALLIEEGQKLSQTELKHMTVIKKLRSKSSEDDKAVADAKRTVEKQERITKEAQEKLKRAIAAEKHSTDRLKSLAKVEKDLDVLKTEKIEKDQLIQDFQIQLSDLTSATRLAEERAKEEALNKARTAAAEFEDELSGLRIEKELAEKEHQNVLREMKEKTEREKERARISEIERQGEFSILESRLESYRARAEEASAGESGDVQAKLLRQIETLQNQYAVASENWQGIEGSLTARVVSLEKERDEIARREAEVRRKARDINVKCRRLEEELERARSKGDDLDTERTSLTSQIKHLRDQLNRTEAEMNAARTDFKNEKESWEQRLAQRLDEERSKVRDEFLRSTPSNIYTQIRAEPPVFQTRTRKSSNAGERSSPQNRRVPSYSALGFSNTSHSPHDRPSSRRSSTLHMGEGNDSRPSSSHPMTRTDSMSTVPNISLNNGIPETPSIDYDAPHAGDDDFFNGVHTPATPPERTINDLVSNSTAGAGPSVQLVERMSAAVRRLESEKEVHKDELARLSRQRDEAREQVVELMRDNEAKKAVDERVHRLEEDSADIKKRYETTLEMLGEKSEKVEELKADIVDLKTLLREMVEERVK